MSNLAQEGSTPPTGIIAAIFILAAVVTIVLAGPTVLRWLRDAYRKTVGRKRYTYKRLSRLAAGVAIERFNELLGSPVIKTVRGESTECIYVDRHFYVFAAASDAQGVLYYSVTARTPKFKPKIWPHNIRPPAHPIPPNYRLGTFMFADMDPEEPSGVGGFVGANRYSYEEAYYFGNPGHYQYYVIGTNDAAPIEGEPELLTKAVSLNVATGVFADDRADEDFDAAAMREFREKTYPNTYGLTAPHIGPKQFPLGVDYAHVGTLID